MIHRLRGYGRAREFVGNRTIRAAEAVVTNATSVLPPAPPIVTASRRGIAPALTVSRIGVLITGLAPWSAVSRGTIVPGFYGAVVSFEPVFTDAEAIKTAASTVPGTVVKHVACIVALNPILVQRTY
jgi:hypothetical protein